MSALPDKKVCPLFFNPLRDKVGDCVESSCGWWNGAGEECCVRTFASFANLKIMDYTTRS